MIRTILTWLVSHQNKLIQAICGLSVAFLLSSSVVLYNLNKKLSESLEMALNNIEAYLGSLAGSLLANNVLKLTVDELQTYNDKLVNKLDSVREELKIKPKHLHTAATQNQLINVSSIKEVRDSIIQVKDSIYNDSIKFNDLTSVYYTITNDSIAIGLDIRNRLYFYIFTDRHYKNKKSFLKRLFTFDFKKVNSYKYEVINENDLVKTEDVKVVEVITK